MSNCILYIIFFFSAPLVLMHSYWIISHRMREQYTVYLHSTFQNIDRLLLPDALKIFIARVAARCTVIQPIDGLVVIFLVNTLSCAVRRGSTSTLCSIFKLEGYSINQRKWWRGISLEEIKRALCVVVSFYWIHGNDTGRVMGNKLHRSIIWICVTLGRWIEGLEKGVILFVQYNRLFVVSE